MRIRCAAVCLAFLPGLAAQSFATRELPEFTANQVGRASGGWNGWLWPGKVHSIYGKHLGPTQSCVRDADFPTELCGVQVLVEGEAVPLVYVHERQINFVVPEGGPTGGRVEIRVLREGVSSLPASVKMGPDRIVLAPPEAAFTGMPVWVTVRNASEANRPLELGFGLSLFQAEMCAHLEVTFHGEPIAKLKIRNMPHQFSFSGNPCTTPMLPKREPRQGRIPLHLRYPFAQPGTYMVRYVPPTLWGLDVAVDSPWTPIEVQAASPEQRRQWLRKLAAAAPTDPEELLYDFLPSIFGYADAAAMRIALPYLYHADREVSGTTAVYLRDYYPAAALVPALRQTVARRGANATVNWLFVQLGAKITP